MKHLMSSLLIIISLSLALVSCGVPRTNVDEVRKELEQGAQRFAAAFNAKDAAAVAAFYGADAVIMPPNGPRISGRTNIESMWGKMIAIGSDMKLTINHVDASGDLAYEIGTYTLGIQMPGASAMTDTGKYVVVWKRQADGKRLIVADIFNSDMPLPAPPTSGNKM